MGRRAGRLERLIRTANGLAANEKLAKLIRDTVDSTQDEFGRRLRVGALLVPSSMVSLESNITLQTEVQLVNATWLLNLGIRTLGSEAAVRAGLADGWCTQKGVYTLSDGQEVFTRYPDKDS